MKLDISSVYMVEPHISTWLYDHTLKNPMCICLRCRILLAVRKPISLIYNWRRGLKHGGWHIEERE